MGMGGIIASAMAGGVAGAGQGLATGAKMDHDADLQRVRDEALAKRDERLLALQQKFQAELTDKTLSHQATLAAQERGSREQMHTESEARGYASLAQQREHGTAQLAEQTRHSKATEGIARTQADTAKASANKIHIAEDGSVNIIGTDGTYKPVVDGHGKILKSERDMSAKELSKVKVLTALIKEEHDLLEKSPFMKDDQQAVVNARIERYTKQIGSLLGMEIGAASVKPGAAGGSKPWERKWTAN